MISWMKNAACDGRASERSLMLFIGSSNIACRDSSKVAEIVDYPLKDSKAGEITEMESKPPSSDKVQITYNEERLENGEGSQLGKQRRMMHSLNLNQAFKLDELE
jgi:hypothetical protein